MSRERPRNQQDPLGLQPIDIRPVEPVYSISIARENLRNLSRSISRGNAATDEVASIIDDVTKNYQPDLRGAQVGFARFEVYRRDSSIDFITSIDEDLKTRVMTTQDLIRLRKDLVDEIYKATSHINDVIDGPAVGVGGDRGSTVSITINQESEKAERAARDVVRELLDIVDFQFKQMRAERLELNGSGEPDEA